MVERDVEWFWSVGTREVCGRRLYRKRREGKMEVGVVSLVCKFNHDFMSARASYLNHGICTPNNTTLLCLSLPSFTSFT